MSSERRQFERLELSSEAIACDATGQRLGMVAQAGGGGLSVRLDDPSKASQYHVGDLMKLTIVEPAPRITHTLEVEVRYFDAGIVGFAFAKAKSAKP